MNGAIKQQQNILGYIPMIKLDWFFFNRFLKIHFFSLSGVLFM